MNFARWFILLISLLLAGQPAFSAPGDSCGGIAGKQCGGGEFCKFELGASCGAGDQTGICVSRPDVCTREFQPVCGCDGETYPNACTANSKGTSIMYAGACNDAQKPDTPIKSGSLCQQVISCGIRDSVIRQYPSPCAAAEDGASMIFPAPGGKCPVSE